MDRRPRAPRGGRGIEADTRDVLDGRTRLAAGELLDLIHAINPTGRQLSAADERRRYDLKAALQSVLVRQFPDDLVVTALAGDLVSIRHRYLRQDACHARLDELEPEARSRLRWLLDLGDAVEPAVAGQVSPSRAAADGDPLAAGRDALAAYDYDAARAHFEAALVATHGGLGAGRALLELLVEHLALDADALLLEDQLADAVLVDAEIRVLLAMAAARAGKVIDAERRLAGLAGSRAAGVWATLARHALDRQEWDALGRHLDQLAACDPAHPEVRQVRDEAAKVRAEERRPVEEALLRLGAGDDHARTEAEARAVLARWPDSAVAGQLLTRAQAAQRHAEGARLLASAEAALAGGGLRRAADLARQAADLGAECTPFLARVQEAEAVAKDAHEGAEVGRVVTLLAGADPRPGLDAYLALEADLRRRVRADTNLPILEWLDAVARSSRAARPRALVDAVLALAAASDALAHGRDDQVIRLLDPHRDLLDGVARAKQVRAQAQQAVDRRRREVATNDVELARRALGGGDLDDCERRCGAIDRRALAATAHAELDRIVHELHRRRDVARRAAAIAALVAAGDLVEAGRELDSLLAVEGVGAELTASLRARRDDVRDRIHREWRVRSDDRARTLDGQDLLGELLGRLPYMERAVPWLAAGGRELVLAAAHGRDLFLVRVSLADRRVIGRVRVQTPEPLGDVVAMTVDGDAVWLVGDAGRVVRLATQSGAPLRWASLGSVMVPPERLEHAFVPAGATHLWFGMSAPGELATEHVIELDGWRGRRDLRRAPPPAARRRNLAGRRRHGLRGWGGALHRARRGAGGARVMRWRAGRRHGP